MLKINDEEILQKISQSPQARAKSYVKIVSVRCQKTISECVLLVNTCLISKRKCAFYAVIAVFLGFLCNYFATLWCICVVLAGFIFLRNYADGREMYGCMGRDRQAYGQGEKELHIGGVE